ncbi:MAG: hypothetical protein SGJ23_07900 [Alphaproteobacteria bacterium]|nr:hypothetical protein [Alphaproteobacteria bacterium]
MNRRAGKEARKRRKDALGMGLIVVVLAALGGLGFAAMQMRTPAHDSETLCLLDKPPPLHTLILVDATDRLNARHQKRLKAVVREEVARLPRWGRLTLMSLRPDAEREPRLLFSACTPGDRSDANPIWENVAALEQNRADFFDEPLDAALSGAKGGRSAEGSPIVEGLYAAASDPDFSGERRRLVLISDLLQYAPGRFSLYDATQTWEKYRASQGALRSPPDLDDVAVRVVVLERADRGDAQMNARKTFWTPYFDDGGAADVAWSE